MLTSHGRPFSTAAANVLSHCRVREISPGTHTFFPTYTCPVYCWRSVQLLDFSLFGNLIHAFQPIRTTFTGQWFASGFLQTPPRDDALASGCILPTAGRIRDFHPLERVPAGHTKHGPQHCNCAAARYLLNLRTLVIWVISAGN
jgi:hypothetical protein